MSNYLNFYSTKCLFIIFSSLVLMSSSEAQTTYYIDAANGNDDWTGTSPATAWQTLAKVNTTAFQPGDSILFKRGENWRGQLVPVSGNASARIYYGAFGSGPLPLIMGSVNMNQPSDWVLESSNIWRCTSTVSTDVGNIIFDNDSHAGIKKWSSAGLLSQDDFHYDLVSGEVRMYSASNPATVHTAIECALRNHIVDQMGRSFITYENLAIKYGAAHGFGGGNTSDITIRNCEISWIGGGDLNMDGQIRFGNGIEFWNNASNHLVENNKIWEIYDTGVTNQSNSYAVHDNIIYRNNVIWNCGMAAVEIWNRPASSITRNIWFENNTCVNMGYGWGMQRPDYKGFCYTAWSNTSQTDSVFIRNNVFLNPLRFFYVFNVTNTFLEIEKDYNCYAAESAIDTFLFNYATHETVTMQNFSTYQANANADWNSILANPEFIDSVNYDFHLSSASPCIDTGLSTNLNYDHDFVFRPQGNGFDIGAYEYVIATTIEEKVGPVLSIYPNPANNVIIIETLENDFYIEFMNIFGQLILKKRSVKEINVSGFAPGTYILRFNGKNYKGGERVIVY